MVQDLQPRSVTVIYADQPAEVSRARTDGRNLWLATDDLTRATGWELKPEGACLGDICVPIPRDREAEFVRPTDDAVWFNFTALADHTGRPVAWDEPHAVWYVGEEASARSGALTEGIAPDFTLPDLEGRLHSLSDHRGKKVLLAAWASW